MLKKFKIKYIIIGLNLKTIYFAKKFGFIANNKEKK